MNRSYLYYLGWFTAFFMTGLCVVAIGLFVAEQRTFVPDAWLLSGLGLSLTVSFLLPVYLVAKRFLSQEMRGTRRWEGWLLAIAFGALAYVLSIGSILILDFVETGSTSTMRFLLSDPEALTGIILVWAIATVVLSLPARLILWLTTRQAAAAAHTQIKDTFS